MLYFYLSAIVLTTFAGGIIPLFYKNVPSPLLTALHVFAGTFLLGITLGDLLPDAFEITGTGGGLFALLGFFGQYFIQQSFPGIEHQTQSPKKNVSLSFPALFLGLSIHSFTAGIPLGLFHTKPAILQGLAIAILVHKIPETLTLMLHAPFSKKNIVRYLLLLVAFALMLPTGALLSFVLCQNILLNIDVIYYITAIVAGAFLEISMAILSETAATSGYLKKFVPVSLALVFVVLTVWLS